MHGILASWSVFSSCLQAITVLGNRCPLRNATNLIAPYESWDERGTVGGQCKKGSDTVTFACYQPEYFLDLLNSTRKRVRLWVLKPFSFHLMVLHHRCSINISNGPQPNWGARRLKSQGIVAQQNQSHAIASPPRSYRNWHWFYSCP